METRQTWPSFLEWRPLGECRRVHQHLIRQRVVEYDKAVLHPALWRWRSSCEVGFCVRWVSKEEFIYGSMNCLHGSFLDDAGSLSDGGNDSGSSEPYLNFNDIVVRWITQWNALTGLKVDPHHHNPLLLASQNPLVLHIPDNQCLQSRSWDMSTYIYLHSLHLLNYLVV